jgi:ethanolamine phosphate phosphodiesterase
MSYAYSRNTGASALPTFISNPKSPKITDNQWNGFSGLATQWVTEGAAAFHTARPRDRHEARSFAVQVFKRVFTVVNAVIVFWMFTLWWGERTVFQESIDACVWENWERWVSYSCL